MATKKKPNKTKPCHKAPKLRARHYAKATFTAVQRVLGEVAADRTEICRLKDTIRRLSHEFSSIFIAMANARLAQLERSRRADEPTDIPTDVLLYDGPLFEVISPGMEFRVYLNGHVEGFPPDSIVVNHALPKVDALLRMIQKAEKRDTEPSKEAGKEP